MSIKTKEITGVKTNYLVDRNLEKVVDQFVSSLDLRERSKESYHKAIRYFLDWLKTENKTTPNREDIIQYKKSLKDRELSPLTITVYLTAVRRFFAYLEGQKIYPNIAKDVKGMKKQNGFSKDILSGDQIKRLLEGIDRNNPVGLRDYAILNLMLRTGLRTIEITRANIGDIGTEGGETVLRIWGKGRDSKDDFVILTQEAYNPILDYLKNRGPTKQDDPLFVSDSNRTRGKRLAIRSIRWTVKDRLTQAGLKTDRITAHSFRHTAGTIALMNGADLLSVKDMLRHANINTTLIYTHNLKRISNPAERYVFW